MRSLSLLKKPSTPHIPTPSLSSKQGLVVHIVRVLRVLRALGAGQPLRGREGVRQSTGRRMPASSNGGRERVPSRPGGRISLNLLLLCLLSSSSSFPSPPLPPPCLPYSFSSVSSRQPPFFDFSPLLIFHGYLSTTAPFVIFKSLLSCIKVHWLTTHVFFHIFSTPFYNVKCGKEHWSTICGRVLTGSTNF